MRLDDWYRAYNRVGIVPDWRDLLAPVHAYYVGAPGAATMMRDMGVFGGDVEEVCVCRLGRRYLVVARR